MGVPERNASFEVGLPLVLVASPSSEKGSSSTEMASRILRMDLTRLR